MSKIEEELVTIVINPWDGNNVMNFSFFCCPECDYKCKSVNHFIEHASQNHPKAKHFCNEIQQQNKCQIIKEEPEIINTRGHYSSAGSNNNAQVKYELPEDVGDYKENDLVDDGHDENALDDPDDEDYIPIKEFQRVKKREYDG